MAAFFRGGKLILEVHAGGPGFNHRLHQFKRVQIAAKTGFGVRDHRRQPVLSILALGVVNLIRAQERLVDTAHEARDAVGRIEALVRVHLPGEIRVGSDLPAADVDRLQSCFDLLNGLVAGRRAESRDVRLAVEQAPKPLRAEARESVFDRDRAAETLDVFGTVRPDDSLPAGIGPPPALPSVGGGLRCRGHASLSLFSGRAGLARPSDLLKRNLSLRSKRWSVKRIVAIILIDKIYQCDSIEKQWGFGGASSHGNPATRDFSRGCKLRRVSSRGRRAPRQPARRERADRCARTIAWDSPV